METTDSVKMLKALGDDTRAKIFEMLQGGELCACKILEKLNITQPTLSHHMKILCDCGLVEAERNWKWMHYSVNRTALSGLIGWLDGDNKKEE